jgi:hypothetical protein
MGGPTPLTPSRLTRIGAAEVSYCCGMGYCTIRTRDDIDWVVDLVLLGDWVSVHVGGLHRPRRHGVGGGEALCSLEDRLALVGAVLRSGCTESALRRLVRGRTALAVPCTDEGGDEAGVREPRNTPPIAPSAAWRLSATHTTA